MREAHKSNEQAYQESNQHKIVDGSLQDNDETNPTELLPTAATYTWFSIAEVLDAVKNATRWRKQLHKSFSRDCSQACISSES